MGTVLWVVVTKERQHPGLSPCSRNGKCAVQLARLTHTQGFFCDGMSAVPVSMNISAVEIIT